MHCSNCGTELPEDAKFCPACGVEFRIMIERPATQASQPSIPPRRAPPTEVPQVVPIASTPVIARTRRSRHGRKASASRIITSLILIFAVVGSAMAIITLVTWGSYKGDAQYLYAPATIPARDSWSFSTDSANLNIQYTTNATAPEIQINVHYDFAGAFMKGKTASDMYTITFDNASKQFSLARKNVWTFAMLDNSSVTVTLNPTVIFGITATVQSGNLGVTIPNGVEVGNLSMTTTSGNNHLLIGTNDTIDGKVQMATTSGNVDVTSGNSTFKQSMAFQATSGNIAATLTRCNASGNIAFNGTSGNMNVNIANMTLGSNIHLDAGVVSGNIIFTVDQSVNPTKNISCYLGAVSGNIDVNYKAKITQSSAMFSSTKVSGTIICTNNGGFEPPASNSNPAVFQTMDQSKPCRFDAKVHTVSGNIRIIGQMYA